MLSAHQLTTLNVHDSNFSMLMLNDLFHHTANLSQISVDQYSVLCSATMIWVNLSMEMEPSLLWASEYTQSHKAAQEDPLC